MERKNLQAIEEFSSRGFVRRRVWQSDHLHCNIYCFEPGQQNSLHRHPVADEVVFCWEGSLLSAMTTLRSRLETPFWSQRTLPTAILIPVKSAA